MENNANIKAIYKNIQKQLFYMIPEKWDAIYLYAAISERLNKLEVGEMFFYYYPKSVIKKKPISVYEISNKFNLDEEEYSQLINKLYQTIKELRDEFKKNKYKVWTNVTIKIENYKFKAEYHYNDLSESKYSNTDRHLVWKFKNLNYPLEKLEKREKKVLLEFLKEEKLDNLEDNVYEEAIYQIPKSNIVDYNRDDNKMNNSFSNLNDNVKNLRINREKKLEKYKKANKESIKNKTEKKEKVKYKNKKKDNELEKEEETVITKSQILRY